jgi:hypothetical protein
MTKRMIYRNNTEFKKLLKNLQKTFPLFRWMLTFLLVLTLGSCVDKAEGQDAALKTPKPTPKISQVAKDISETSPPAIIQSLRPSLETYQPQVKILTPSPDEVISDDTVEVSFQVNDLPIFKDNQWKLGPHLHVILDNNPYIAVYDLDKPLVLSDLSAGTHTLRVFASRPWHESFKNEGAYAQMQFHVLTKSDDNNPDPNLPLLTYSRPNGGYGAEPIMLDFYLTNAPLHITGEDNPDDTLSDWRIRCTINGESFVLDRWQTVYLKGFKPGKNWVELEFLDNQGNPVKNVFNSTVRMINYQPGGNDTLSKIVRGEVTADQVRSIVDPNYTTKSEATTAPATKEEKPTTPEIETPEKVETQEEESATPEIETPDKVETQEEKPTTSEIETPEKVETQEEESATPEIETPEKVETQEEESATPELKISAKPEIKEDKSTTSETEVKVGEKDSKPKQKVFRQFNEKTEIKPLKKEEKKDKDVETSKAVKQDD